MAGLVTLSLRAKRRQLRFGRFTVITYTRPLTMVSIISGRTVIRKMTAMVIPVPARSIKNLPGENIDETSLSDEEVLQGCTAMLASGPVTIDLRGNFWTFP